MGRSLPQTLTEGESTDGTRQLQDVKSELRKPLISELSKGTAKSNIEKPNPRYSGNLGRGKSSPGFDSPKLEKVSVPRRNEKEYSVLCWAVSAVVIYFAVGICSFYLYENNLFGTRTQSFVDALYFCVVTLTTVGYGDLVPGTTAGKLITCIYVFVGFGLVGAVISGAANYIVERQEEILVHAIRRKDEDDDFELAEEDDLQAANGKALVSGLLVLGVIIVGTVFLIKVEEMTFVDAFYCVCVTVTTLGYGDHSFQTAPGRVFGAVWILSSTVCVAQFFLYLAEMRTGRRQLQLANWVLHRRTTKTDLEAADLDNDGVVTAPEFIIFKLKELGKIDQEDVLGILREFRKLDVDHSGTISIGDISAEQGS